MQPISVQQTRRNKISAQTVRQESYLPRFAALFILTQVLFRCATAAKISGSLAVPLEWREF
jgi:hypothetical protein